MLDRRATTYLLASDYQLYEDGNTTSMGTSGAEIFWGSLNRHIVHESGLVRTFPRSPELGTVKPIRNGLDKAFWSLNLKPYLPCISEVILACDSKLAGQA